MPPSQYVPAGWPNGPLPSGPLEDLPLSDPHCQNNTCRAFGEGFADDERKTPLLALLEYGTWTVWFYSFWILLFTAIYLYQQVHDRLYRKKQVRGHPSFKDKVLATLRFYTYRRPDNRFSRAVGLRQISYGTLSFLAFATIFMGILPWPQQRYLRERFRFGSPPLSVRCAMIISALTPLTVALAGKVNIITWMTGIGYEKLNVYHRYVAYLIFALSTVHTVPHLIAPVQDGGWEMLNALYANQHRELSGTPLYFATFGLAFFSIPWVRKRFYEAFKYVHIFLAIAYIGMFWWHIYGEYMSPYYIYATIASLFFSYIIRLFHRHHNLRSVSNLAGFPTTATHLHGNATRLVVKVPKSMKWKAGQHAFLRIPNVSLIDNHPFSMANVPSNEQKGNSQDMVFLMRRQNGFTKKLLECDQSEANASTTESLRYSSDLENYDPPSMRKAKISDFNEKNHASEDMQSLKGADFANNSLAEVPTVVEKEISSPLSSLVAESPASQSSSNIHSGDSKLKLYPTDTIPPTLSSAPSTSTKATLCCSSSLPPMDEITAEKLAVISNKKDLRPSLRTIIDGPYGTHHRPIHKIFDTALFVAGGSGITACLSHVLELTERLKSQQKNESFATKRIHLVWVIRDAGWITWVERELDTAMKNINNHPSPNACTLKIDVFVTRSSALAESASPSENDLSPVGSQSQVGNGGIQLAFEDTAWTRAGSPNEKSAATLPSRPRPALRKFDGGLRFLSRDFNDATIGGGRDTARGASIAIHHHRPVVKEVVEGCISGERMVIKGCGPPSLAADLANATAALQKRIWNNEMRELQLDIETFGW